MKLEDMQKRLIERLVGLEWLSKYLRQAEPKIVIVSSNQVLPFILQICPCTLE